MYDLWNPNFYWNSVQFSGSTSTGLTFSGSTSTGLTYWIQTPKYIPTATYYDDIYFKYQKCLSGITYTYINTLEDIYKTDYLVSDDGISIYNMYTEYDIIDHFLKNLNYVDIATYTNISINSTQKVIDNITLKPNHKILLMVQNNLNENDVYVVNSNGILTLNTDLSSNINSDKYKAYCRLGSSFDKQLFLDTLNPTFPITGETKNFREISFLYC